MGLFHNADAFHATLFLNGLMLFAAVFMRISTSGTTQTSSRTPSSMAIKLPVLLAFICLLATGQASFKTGTLRKHQHGNGKAVLPGDASFKFKAAATKNTLVITTESGSETCGPSIATFVIRDSGETKKFERVNAVKFEGIHTHYSTQAPVSPYWIFGKKYVGANAAEGGPFQPYCNLVYVDSAGNKIDYQRTPQMDVCDNIFGMCSGGPPGVGGCALPKVNPSQFSNGRLPVDIEDYQSTNCEAAPTTPAPTTPAPTTPAPATPDALITSDMVATGNGAADGKDCVMAEIGVNPNGGTMEGTVEDAGHVCPSKINRNNWNPRMFDGVDAYQRYGDSFTVVQTGTKLAVTRSDTGNAGNGWQLDLAFTCCWLNGPAYATWVSVNGAGAKPGAQ